MSTRCSTAAVLAVIVASVVCSNATAQSLATLLTGTATIGANLSSSTVAVRVNVPFTLTWTATPGSTCTAGGDTQFNGPVAASGSKVITEPAAESVTFTLSCNQGTQSAQSQVTVTVSAPAVAPSGGGGSLDLVSAAVLLVLWRLRLAKVRRNYGQDLPDPRSGGSHEKSATDAQLPRSAPRCVERQLWDSNRRVI